jgi:hypothetical protein
MFSLNSASKLNSTVSSLAYFSLILQFNYKAGKFKGKELESSLWCEENHEYKRYELMISMGVIFSNHLPEPDPRLPQTRVFQWFIAT